jgi:hypothetical protein
VGGVPVQQDHVHGPSAGGGQSRHGSKQNVHRPQISHQNGRDIIASVRSFRGEYCGPTQMSALVNVSLCASKLTMANGAARIDHAGAQHSNIARVQRGWTR